MLRGINKQVIFESNDDYWKFIRLMYRLIHPIDETGYPLSPHCGIYAYCLMSNHVHLLIKDIDNSLASTIKGMTIPYAQYFNKKYDRVGHFFQDRFKSEPVNDWDYFVTLLRYIHQNPVAAGLTKPASVECGHGVRLTLVESDLESYPGMFVVPARTAAAGDEPEWGIKAVFAHYPATFAKYSWRDMSYVESTCSYISVSKGARTYPWRILKITGHDSQLPVDNLVYALAKPMDKAAFANGTDWIKPGFSAWEWWNDWGLEGVDFKPGINQRTYEYYIDFAARNGLEYVVLDEGWYPVDQGLIMQPVPEINLPALVQYGRQRGVRLILWAIFNTVDEQLEDVMSHYSGMGIAGFKIDFLDRNDQTAVEMAWRIADAAARHHMILDYHGIFPPAGLSRTYPNVVNYEGILGLENCKWNDTEAMDHPLYDVTVAYLRGMCGYADYTPGAMKNAYRKDFKVDYSKPMSMGTRAHQLALYITMDSPLSMLADTPTNYEQDQVTTSFLASLPRSYDEKRVVAGEMGQYIVVARRSGQDWYVGGLTNWDSRNIDMDWSFLDSGLNYTIQAYTDADRAQSFRLSQTTPSECRSIHLASGGGFLLKVIADRN